MTNLDNDIRKAMAAESNALAYDDDREEGLREMMAGSFRGKTRWMVAVAWVESLVFFGLAIFAAVKFFSVDGVWEWIFYATLFLTTSMAMVLVKLWYWMLMNRNSIQREIKRLELRVLELARPKGE